MAAPLTVQGVKEWVFNYESNLKLNQDGFYWSTVHALALLGYSELKKLQMQVILAFVMGQDLQHLCYNSFFPKEIHTETTL